MPSQTPVEPSGKSGVRPMSRESSARRQKLGGLLVCKQRWGLSWRGWLALIVVGLTGVISLLVFIRPFLAVTDRVDSDVLVVEGWIDQSTAPVAVTEFKTHSDRQVFTTGGPVKGVGTNFNDYHTLASVGAGLLIDAGMPRDCVQMVPCHESGGHDRTYNSALALKRWFKEHNLQVRRFNLLTEDAHARRSRLLFQEAFGDTAEVGVISVPDPDYDPARWWKNSEGVRVIIGESIAYIYARFFFHPA